MAKTAFKSSIPVKKAKAHNNKSEKKISAGNQSAYQDSSLHNFFVKTLQQMYWSEKTLIDALEKMQQAASVPELQDAFEDHKLQTQKHVSRLEKVFKMSNTAPDAKECAALSMLIKEAEEIINETEEGSATRDAALIIAAQKTEHYEIATYGGLVALARTMDLDDEANLLEITLEEEEETDKSLTDIAESYINFESFAEEKVQ